MKPVRLFHISETPGIMTFIPRPSPADGIRTKRNVVWAITETLLHNYLLPRDCPRVTFYPKPDSHQGCPFGGYFSSNSATLPAAMKTGNMTLRPYSIVLELIYDKDKKKAKGVRILDSETMKTEEYYAKIIFLNASTLGTASILLNSVSDAFPQGFGNSSGQVGHNLMDHHYGVGANGDFDGFQDKYFYGRRPNGIYIPRFRNISELTKHTDYVRGFGYQGGAGRGRQDWADGVGIELKEQLTEPGGWSMGMGSWGECLPYFENKITLNKDKKDKWGLATLDIDCEFKENEQAMRKDMMNSAAEMLEKGGLKNISTYDSAPAPGVLYS